MKKLFPDFHITFMPIEAIRDSPFPQSDIIVLGGGDVMNEYFLNIMYDVFKNRNNIIIAISVGLPYPSFLVKNSSKLKIFSKIYLRTKQDLLLMGDFFPMERIEYIPDVSICFNKTNGIRGETSNKLGICLNRCIYNDEHKEFYLSTLYSLSQFVIQKIRDGKYIKLIPFNTNTCKDSECDIKMQQDLLNMLPEFANKYVECINRTLSIPEMDDEISECYVLISMRFHPILFSIYNKVPVIPLITTRKCKNLMRDLQYSDFIEISKEHELDITELTKIIKRVEENLVDLQNKMENAIMENMVIFNNISNSINELLSINNLQNISIENINNTVSSTIKKLEEYNIEWNLTKDEVDKIYLVQLVSYYLTHNIHSVYNYGLLTKMFERNFNAVEEFSWIVIDNRSRSVDLTMNKIDGKYNISFTSQQDLVGIHRSGWNYVYDHIKQYNDVSENTILLDLYLDRTFHWQHRINKTIGFIPYTKNWAGVIHHTFDTSFSTYNTENMFNNKSFIESLETCKGLIVLSKNLKKQVESKLKSMCIAHVPVYNLIHPTEIPDILFTMKNFLKNDHKKILHIGAWMRDIYSFYTLNIPKNITSSTSMFFIKSKKYPINKCILIGKEMGGYFPSTNFLNDAISTEHTEFKDLYSKNVSCSTNKNNWYFHCIQHHRKLIEEVPIMKFVENDYFDKLLSENIVCINLIDASAVNTVIECIVRDTPIIINRHPAIIEMLGDHYPLFFDSINDVYELITFENIKAAHKYIKKLDISKYKITHFIKSLNGLACFN
jgi:hypothetical protein